MGKRTRRAFNMAAGWLEDASERAVTWLRAKGERPMRQKPLAFETSYQAQMREIMECALRNIGPSVFANLRRSPLNVPTAAQMRNSLRAYRYEPAYEATLPLWPEARVKNILKIRYPIEPPDAD